MLLKSCAIPPASVPMASSFCAWRSCVSSRCRSRSECLRSSMFSIEPAMRSGVPLTDSLVLVLRDAVPVHAVSSWGERLVGLVLIGIGIWGTRAALLRNMGYSAPRIFAGNDALYD